MESINGNMADVNGIRGPVWLRRVAMFQFRAVGWNVYLFRRGKSSWQYRVVLEWYGPRRTFSIWRNHHLLVQVRFGRSHGY